MTDTPTPTITGDIEAKRGESAFDELKDTVRFLDELVSDGIAAADDDYLGDGLSAKFMKSLISEHAALLAERDALREAVTQIRNDIFQHMVRFVHDKNSKSYALIGTVKERLTKALTSPERTER